MDQATTMPMPFDGYHPIRNGLRNLKADAQPRHPVEQMQKKRQEDWLKLKLQATKQMHGSAAAARMHLESQLVTRHRLAGLPSSNLGMATLHGHLDRFGPEDYLGLEEFDTDMPCDQRFLLEKKHASREEVKDAFYRQAKQWHPDKNKSAFAADRFRQVQEAADTLLAKEGTDRWSRIAQRERVWASSANEARGHGVPLATRSGVRLTVAACGLAICSSLVLFGVKWHNHEAMYPRVPRGFQGSLRRRPVQGQLQADDPQSSQ